MKQELTAVAEAVAHGIQKAVEEKHEALVEGDEDTGADPEEVVVQLRPEGVDSSIFERMIDLVLPSGRKYEVVVREGRQ